MNEEIYNDLQKIIIKNNDLIKQTFGLINQNFSFCNNGLSTLIEKRVKEL